MLKEKVVHNFVETELNTKFAQFNIRVYVDPHGKEVPVLWTKNIDCSKPVLLRVHSECITGDLFGSLHCDCGNQFTKSLNLISEEEGILIYLRQEGRGIGLVEKIKSYQLQSKGYDTFEANIMLGHQPDQRSYEMVKIILDDLNVGQIRLITNNPSKVSEIAKLNIDVVERVPIICKPNKHNKNYLETKKSKFHHFLKQTKHDYFHQFNVQTAEQVLSIIDFVRTKIKDPFLKIGVAITATPSSFNDLNEIKRIGDIIEACKKHPKFKPTIHLSFLKSTTKNPLESAKEIKKLWPTIQRLQINDFPHLEIETLKKLSEMFSLDIPLSDENFSIIENSEFRELVKRNESIIVLDNSKGKGVEEEKDIYIKKIDTLLEKGLNDICLCGGFGPDRLLTYFELRRYYKFNFSIDAETNLKTNGIIDTDKIALYLQQLIRFDDPKLEEIKQARKFLEGKRRINWEKTTIHGVEFSIHPNVFHAGHFPASAWFANELRVLLQNETNFCEIGCGSGVISCLVALAHPHLQVTATDINPHATENTRINVKELEIESRVATLTGDVLDSVEKEKRFDSIFWALPFVFLDPGSSINLEEAQVFDPGYRAIRKFFQSAKSYLKENGRLLIGFSNNLGHSSLLKEIAKEASLTLRTVSKKTMKEDVEIDFEILEGRYLE